MTIAGRVVRPLGSPIQTVVVQRRLSCGRYQVVKRFKPPATGASGSPSAARAAARPPPTGCRRGCASSRATRSCSRRSRCRGTWTCAAAASVAASEMRRTKIVATIGPASRDPEVLVRMVEAGMDVARLNFSHGTAEQHAETASRVRQAAGRAGRQVAVLQDLPGPKLRIGPLHGRDRRAQARRPVDLRLRRERRRGRRPPHVHHLGRAGRHRRRRRDHVPRRRRRAPAREATRPGDGEIDAVVEVGGTVASRQGLNIPGETAALPSVPEEDLDHVRTGRADRRRPRRALVRAPRRGRRRSCASTRGCR